MIPTSGPSLPPSLPSLFPPARFLHLLLPQTSRGSRQRSPNIHRLKTLRRSTTTTTRRHILRACDSWPPQGHIFVTWMAPSKTRGARAAWGPGRHLTVVNVSNNGHVTDVLGLVHDGTKLGDGKVHLRTGEKKEAHAIETSECGPRISRSKGACSERFRHRRWHVGSSVVGAAPQSRASEEAIATSE